MGYFQYLEPIHFRKQFFQVSCVCKKYLDVTRARFMHVVLCILAEHEFGFAESRKKVLAAAAAGLRRVSYLEASRFCI